MFPLAKRDINEWDSRYEPKNNLPGGLNKVCRQPPCLSSTRVVAKVVAARAARAIVAHKTMFNLLTYLLLNILEITHVKL